MDVIGDLFNYLMFASFNVRVVHTLRLDLVSLGPPLPLPCLPYSTTSISRSGFTLKSLPISGMIESVEFIIHVYKYT